MALYQLKTEQNLPISLDQAWSFLSSPKNLSQITPTEMDFKITNPYLPEEMYIGTMVSYTLRPLFGIRARWVTEITHIEDKNYFIDEQRSGPYAIWHHEHRLKEIDGGVQMTDLLSYQPPFGILGDIANRLFLRKKIEQIFEYRRQALIFRFGEYKQRR